MALRRDRHVTLVDSNDAFYNLGNPLPVTLAGGASGGSSQADESAFVEGTTAFNPVGGVFNETIVSDPTEDQAAAARITAKRALHVNLRDAAGAELTKSNNSGAPGATNLGVLPAIASSALQSYTAGNQVLLSATLNGGLRVTGLVPDDGVTTNTNNPLFIGGEDSSGLMRGFRVGDAAGLPSFRTLAVAQYVFDAAQPSATAWQRRTAYLGTHGNAWNNVAVLANGLSAIINVQQQAFVSVFGVSSVGGDIYILYSQNGVDVYRRDTFTVSAGVSAGKDYTCGAAFVQLQSVSASTITMTIAAKTG